jgi:hypothetical protein
MNAASPRGTRGEALNTKAAQESVSYNQQRSTVRSLHCRNDLRMDRWSFDQHRVLTPRHGLAGR